MKHSIKKAIKTGLLTLLTFMFAFTQASAQANPSLGATCNLTVSINGNTVYSGGAVTQPTVTIHPGNVLSFNLAWTVTDTRYIIQNGDELTFNILSMSNPAYLSILAPSENIALKINGVQVGTGKFIWNGNVLQYVTTFNSAAKNYLIKSGNASGNAQFKINETESPFDIEFEFGAIGQFTPAPAPSPGEGGGGSGTIPTGTWERAPEPRNEPDIYKGLNADRRPNIMPHEKVNVNHANYNGDYYGFTWLVPFYGLQKLFENDPERKPTDYVIVEDIISANMQFAGFYRPETGGYERNDAFDFYSNFSPVSPSPNFFSVEVGLRSLGLSDSFEYSAADLVEEGTINVGGPIMFQSEFTEIPATLLTAATAEAAVRNTPFTYSVIPLSDGRTKLIIRSRR